MTAAFRTKYAADPDGMVCLLLDIRGNARDRTLQVFSYGKGEIVNLPRFKYGTREPQIVIETPNAKRWAAVTVPRWYRNKYGLFGGPAQEPVMSGFCREHCTDMRTPQMVRDEGERELALYVVSRENRYRRMPGQRAGMTQRDYVSARAFE